MAGLAASKFYPAGSQANEGDYLPGDFILVHSTKLVPRMIQFGQRLHFRGDQKKFAYWNHTALYIGDGTLIEAKGRYPVREVPLSYYDNRDYIMVETEGSTEMRQNAIAYAKAKCGEGYNYLLIVSLVFWCLFGGNLTFGFSAADICSGLVAQALERLGYIFERAPETEMPADLARHFKVV